MLLALTLTERPVKLCKAVRILARQCHPWSETMGWLVLCGAIEQGESLAVCQSKPAHDLDDVHIPS